MELKAKFLSWSAGVPVAMINRSLAEELGINPNDRVLIKTLGKDSKFISTVLGLVENIVNKKQIGLSSEVKKILNLRPGQKVDVNLAPNPESLEYIKEKLKGVPFTQQQVSQIIKDLVNNLLSEAEVSLFISAMHKQGMTFKETIYLIDAMVDAGERMKISGKYVVDKHSIGGIPGNRTTPIVVSICAAAGLKMPKNSSRAITSAAGTADVVETLAKVEFSKKHLKKIIEDVGACFVWEGHVGIVPADSKIIKIEKRLKIDPKAQMLASIMAKKLAAGSNYILIDIPCGKTAKVTRQKAFSLKEKFEQIGKHYKKQVRVVLTDGSQPIGRGVGPALEMRDVLSVLDPEKKGPEDLEKKSIFLAGQIFEMVKKAKKGKGEKMAEEILKSGKAFEKFKQIIKAQEGEIKNLELPKYKKEILSSSSGKVLEISNTGINSLARVAGCPFDKFSGVYLNCKVGINLKKGDSLLIIYSETKSRLKQAVDYYKKTKPILIK
jgi:AMP phosphorylase